MGFDQVLHCCILDHECEWILWEFHARVTGGHVGGKATARKVFTFIFSLHTFSVSTLAPLHPSLNLHCVLIILSDLCKPIILQTWFATLSILSVCILLIPIFTVRMIFCRSLTNPTFSIMTSPIPPCSLHSELMFLWSPIPTPMLTPP